MDPLRSEAEIGKRLSKIIYDDKYFATLLNEHIVDLKLNGAAPYLGFGQKAL